MQHQIAIPGNPIDEPNQLLLKQRIERESAESMLALRETAQKQLTPAGASV
jgi:hypothetical protein